MIRQIAACAAFVLVAASGPVMAQQQGNGPLAAVVAAYEQLDRHADPVTEIGRAHV